MKKIISALLFLSLALAETGIAAPKYFSSEISDVNVYLQGAVIKRSAKVKLDPGVNEVTLVGLSNYLDISSVRMESNGSITIMSVNAVTNAKNPLDKTDKEKQLEYSLDTTQAKATRLQNEYDSYYEELQMLKANYSIKPSDKNSFSDALETSADFMQKRIREVLNELTALGKIKTVYTQKVTDIQNEINGIKSRFPEGQIAAVISSQGYADVTLSFSYYVEQAGWIPVYNMRAESDTSNINLDYDAEIKQTTGEDWKNVKLTLSTGNPSTQGVKPKMGINYVDYYQYVPRGHFRSENKAIGYTDKVIHKYESDTFKWNFGDGEGYVNTTDYASQYTALSKNILATTFEINLRYDIMSNGEAKHVRIQQYSLPAKFTYTALPKICTDAFLEADVTGWEEYNLLPGEVNIFLEKSYVGKSFIDPTTTKDTLAISFGKDKKINIRRVRVKNFTSNQFLGSNKVQSFGFATSIRNTKGTPITIKVQDQIPVSAQKDIVVELKESSGASLDPATGTLTWQVTLDPGQEKALKFEYSVKYPKNKEVTGL